MNSLRRIFGTAVAAIFLVAGGGIALAPSAAAAPVGTMQCKSINADGGRLQGYLCNTVTTYGFRASFWNKGSSRRLDFRLNCNSYGYDDRWDKFYDPGNFYSPGGQVNSYIFEDRRPLPYRWSNYYVCAVEMFDFGTGYWYSSGSGLLPYQG